MSVGGVLMIQQLTMPPPPKNAKSWSVCNFQFRSLKFLRFAVRSCFAVERETFLIVSSSAASVVVLLMLFLTGLCAKSRI